MNKIGLYAWFGGNVSIEDRFSVIKEVGFDCVALYWGNDYLALTGNNDQTIQLVQDKYHLEVENLHAPYSDADDLFSNDDKKANHILKIYQQCILDAAKYHVPVVVIHLSGNHIEFSNFLKNMNRIQTLVNIAKENDVKIAFENLIKEGYPLLEKVLDTYKDDCVGFCYDVGHDYIHSQRPLYLLKKYQSRLFALHLHSNNGIEDEHKRVSEGIVNCQELKKIIKDINCSCPISLEVIQNLHFASLDEFKDYVSLLKKDCEFFIK